MARSLPVYDHADAIADAVRRHQVVVIEGPTGSGKTTQVPQIIADAGITDRMIGVTQPRRIAAVSVAWRMAAEREGEVGDEVGYAIRFDDTTSDKTRIKVMTDGILLQEARSDHDFDRYGVIIVDEAHERTLNIDFTLGLLFRALKGRADLRVVVSSATLQPELFQRFFAGLGTPVPVVSIDARPHPVNIDYRPLRGGSLDEVVDAMTRAIFRHHRGGQGDILAFFSGQAAINRTAEALARKGVAGEAEILPVYGALPREDQERVFADFPGRRKIVLATNIAETSVTVPGVRHVVDSGRVKIMRVDARTGVRTLREEMICRASAEQRAGRAGRTAPGTCVRLYSKRELRDRPEFIDEEMLRLDLREVVIRLADLGVKDIERFRLPTRPPRRRLMAAIDQLQAMQAIDQQRNLTSIGRRMAVFPLSPGPARMVVEAADHHPEVLDDVLMLAACISGRQPWVFTAGDENNARQAHRRFSHQLGDALAVLGLMQAYRDARHRKAFCRRNHVDPDIMAYNMRAWEQLRDQAVEMGMDVRAGGRPADIIRCLAAGYTDNLLVARGRYFETLGGLRVSIHPGSCLWGTDARFIVAADLIVLRRPYAAQVSVIRADWLPELNPEAARQWHVRERHKKLHQRKKLTSLDVPERVEVDGTTLAVKVHKGRAVVQIPREYAARLRSVRLANVDADVLKLRSAIVVGEHRLSPGVQLRTQLALLPALPLPAGEIPKCPAPEGALLDFDRNLHAIGRHIPATMTAVMPARGRSPGWLSLIANGVGTYWYEVVTGFRDALQTTVLSLEDLQQRLTAGDELESVVTTRLQELTPMGERVKSAYARGPRRGRRQR